MFGEDAVKTISVIVTLAAAVGLCASADAQMVLDLTHPIPTFKPTADEPMQPDLSQPWGEDIGLFPTFGQQAVMAISEFSVGDGHFDTGVLVLAEHHGTHLDSPSHFVNSDESMEAGGTPNAERKHTHQLDAAELTGRVVLVDISGRVQSELDKNGGKPSPDIAVTDFSNSSAAVVSADDISAIADQLADGVWLVLNLGWSQFYFSGPDFAGPYVNNFNHPGLSKAAVDKLIEIMDEKSILIGGIVADNIGIDSGESGIGEQGKWINSWHAHVRLLQRGVKFVENAANLDQLSQVSDPSKCLLSVGAPKHVHGSGGPARVIAICNQLPTGR